MLTVGQNVNRRELLRIGGLGSAGLALPELLRAEETRSTRPKSVIYIILDGGISHIDSYDLKPNAPAEFRGLFQPIATCVPGIQLCELFPKQAAIADRLAIINGVRSIENDHFLAEVYSGLPRTSGKRPAFGCVASKLLGDHAGMPPYVSIRSEPSRGPDLFNHPHYAGSAHAAFEPFGDALQNLSPTKSLERLEDRKQLLRSFDQMRRDLDTADALRGLDRFQARALEMITSPRVRDAFDLSREPQRVVERYGKGKYTHQTVKSLLYDWPAKWFLRARRLVEAGVRIVTMHVGSWDHHSGAEQDIFYSYRHCFPALDHSVWALVTDLEERGLLDEVLVVVISEFGRTPKITYPGPGREHWAEAGSIVMAGGGFPTGQVIGKTDSRAERSIDGKIGFQNVMSTIYHHLGIDPRTTLTDFTSRPQYLLDDPTPITALVG